MFHAFLMALVWTSGVLLLVAGMLHLLPRVGMKGVTGWLAHAPGLDLLVTIFTVLPLIVCPIRWHWMGLLGAWVGQYVALLAWCGAHEMAHRRGARMFRVHNRLVGFGRNMTALFVTSWVAPLFWLVRMAELFAYPFLIWLTRFPRYNHKEWVNVTRHKFDGLVGHDRIWCLYCDWMTGIWSLGSEMLRNVESFWCPVRFGDPTKCENCKIDFPDVAGPWVPANATVDDIVKVLQEKYIDDQPAANAWFGHPVRLTVKGKSV